MTRMIQHAHRRFNRLCRESMLNGPTFSKAIVGRGVQCTIPAEELHRPYAEMDRLDAEYVASEQFVEDRVAIKDTVKLVVEKAAPFGTMLMRQ